MKPLTILLLAVLATSLGAPDARAQSAAEKIYKELAALPAAERLKRLEDGARREGKLVLIHTMRGSQSTNHAEAFRKRFPFVRIELEGNIGSQDAAERLYAEETAGRHLTDVINVALPDLPTLIERNLLARYSASLIDKVLPQYKGFLDKEGRWTPWY